MIEYIARYENGHAPTLLKVLIENGVELMAVSLTPHNRDELSNVPEETIRGHIENLVQYMKDTAQRISMTPTGANPREGWPVVGWKTLQDINVDISNWWNYIEFRDEDTGNSNSPVMVL
jgi:hypothetical protein